MNYPVRLHDRVSAMDRSDKGAGQWWWEDGRVWGVGKGCCGCGAWNRHAATECIVMRACQWCGQLGGVLGVERGAAQRPGIAPLGTTS